MNDLFTKTADGKIEVKITDAKHRFFVGKLVGVASIKDALEKKEATFGKLPGFSAAIAIVEREMADARLRFFTLNMRAAGKAGVDLTQYTVRAGGLETIELVPIADIESEEAGVGPEMDATS